MFRRAIMERSQLLEWGTDAVLRVKQTGSKSGTLSKDLYLTPPLCACELQKVISDPERY